MPNHKKQLDKWEELLEVQIKILQECQITKNLNSCTPYRTHGQIRPRSCRVDGLPHTEVISPRN